MAVRKAPNRNKKSVDSTPTQGSPAELAMSLDRISRLLAIAVVRDMAQSDKIATLSATGFAHADVANLLGLTSNAVAVALYKARSKK